MNDPHGPKKSKAGWVKYALILSLGANLVIVGVVGGAFLRGGAPEPVRLEREIGALGLRMYYRALPDDHQLAIRKSVNARRDDFRQERQTMRTHTRALAAALEAEPFDPTALKHVLQTHAAAVGNLVTAGQDILLDQLLEMDEAERKKLAKKLRRAGNRPAAEGVRRQN